MTFANARAFYNKLEDEESRMIFLYRLNYLFTGDREYLREMTINVNKRFHPAKIVRNVSYLLDNKELYKQGVIIYSLGENTEHCISLFKDKQIPIYAICDMLYKKYEADGYLGIPVISPDEMNTGAEYKNYTVVMSNAVWQQTNCDILIANGYSADNLFVIEGQYNFSNYKCKPSYFEQDFLELTDNETYIDVGCFNADTIKQFNKACSGKYNKIYGFEPHPDNYRLTTTAVEEQGLKNTYIIPKGAWSAEGEHPFISGYGDGTKAGARIIDHGDMTVKTITLDKALENEVITFIKMDIEGAEYEALKGAEKIIKRCKPKLAICLYHKPEDILEIPVFLYSIMPEYKYYIRHHNYIREKGNLSHDTVLYAV